MKLETLEEFMKVVAHDQIFQKIKLQRFDLEYFQFRAIDFEIRNRFRCRTWSATEFSIKEFFRENYRIRQL